MQQVPERDKPKPRECRHQKREIPINTRIADVEEEVPILPAVSKRMEITMNVGAVHAAVGHITRT